MTRRIALALFTLSHLALASVAGPAVRAAQGDTFVPIHAEAKQALAHGDRALLQARETGAERTWSDALDAWQSALEATTVEDLVPLAVQEQGDEVWPDADGSFSVRNEGVAVAVLRRLTQLEAGERARWSTRFAELAQKRLTEASSTKPLMQRVERNFPATRAAALASLRLADQQLELGAVDSAKLWLERARQHATLATGLEDLLAAVALRDDFIVVLAPPPAPESWRSATELKLVREINLYTTSSGVSSKGEGFDRGLIPGGVFLDDGRIVIHHPAAVFVVDESVSGPIFEPRKLLEGFPRRSGATFAPGGQAWPLEPATNGEDLFFVLGRAIIAGNTSAVCRLAPPSATGEVAHLRWVMSTQGHAGSDGIITPLEEFLEVGTWEFQPGPVVFDSMLLVQARQWLPVESGSGSAVDTSRPSCYALALDLETGKPLWSRFLGKGSDVQRDFGTRFGAGGRPAAPAQPIALSNGRAFCATGVGLGALLNLADGRVEWTFRPKRRDSEEQGWARPHRPGIVTAKDLESVLWGPPDSRNLYWLRARADFEGTGLTAFAPASMGSSVAVLGDGDPAAVLLGFAGAARSLSSLDPETGRITQGLRLRRTEEFRGPSLASDSRVFLCTDRTLYLFDRERELLLLESHGLQAGDSAGGGPLIAKDGRVVVLGSNRVFVFEAVE